MTSVIGLEESLAALVWLLVLTRVVWMVVRPVHA